MPSMPATAPARAGGQQHRPPPRRPRPEFRHHPWGVQDEVRRAAPAAELPHDVAPKPSLHQLEQPAIRRSPPHGPVSSQSVLHKGALARCRRRRAQPRRQPSQWRLLDLRLQDQVSLGDHVSIIVGKDSVVRGPLEYIIRRLPTGHRACPSTDRKYDSALLPQVTRPSSHEGTCGPLSRGPERHTSSQAAEATQ